MSDISFEQMKTLFENLQDRLDRTAGDKLSNDELERIRLILDKTQKLIAKDQKAGAPFDSKKFISDFFQQWNQNAPVNNIRRASQSRSNNRSGGNGSSAGGSSNNSGGTFIERQLRDRAAAESEAADVIGKSSKKRAIAENGVLKNLNTLATGLNSFGSKITGVVGALQKGTLGGLSGGALGAVFKGLDDRADAYRTMIATGEGQFSSIQQMTNAVNDAHMTVTELADAMKGSQAARLYGGANYTSLIGGLTKATDKIGNMGLNFEQRSEATQAYLEMTARQGNLRNLSQDQMVAGIQSIVRSSEESANILGLTRKDVLEARKEQASDVNIGNILKARGITGDAATSVYDTANTLKTTFGDIGEKLFKQLVAGVAPSGEAAKFAATDQDAYRLIQSMANQARSGQVVNQQAVASQLISYGNRNYGSGLNEYKAQLALTGQNPLGEAGAASLGGAQRSTYLGTGKLEEKLGNDGTVAQLGVEEALRASATTLRESFDTMMNSISNEYGPQLRTLVQDTKDMAESAREWIRAFQGMPEITSKLGLGFVGIAAGLSLFGGAVSTVTGLFKGFGAIKNLLGMGRGAAAGGAGAGGAAAGAGAGGGAGAGTSAIQRFKNMLTGGGAGAGVKAAGRAVRGNALIGSLFESIDYLTGAKDLSWKNLAKSGLRVGGGALGGLLGGVAGGGVGSLALGAAGGYGGYKAGDALGNWLLGPDDVASKSSTDDQGTKNNVKQNSAQPNQQPRPANASGQRRDALSPEQMNLRIMTAQEQAVNHLKTMRENSDTLNNLIREEIAVMRTYGDRMNRLLEEGNKNTRNIADNSV